MYPGALPFLHIKTSVAILHWILSLILNQCRLFICAETWSNLLSTTLQAMFCILWSLSNWYSADPIGSELQ